MPMLDAFLRTRQPATSPDSRDWISLWTLCLRAGPDDSVCQRPDTDGVFPHHRSGLPWSTWLGRLKIDAVRTHVLSLGRPLWHRAEGDQGVGATAFGSCDEAIDYLLSLT